MTTPQPKSNVKPGGPGGTVVHSYDPYRPWLITREADGRTKAGMALREERVEQASQLRREGWAYRDIAWKLGISDSAASAYAWEGGAASCQTDPNKRRLWVPTGHGRVFAGNRQERSAAETELRKRTRMDWEAASAIARGDRFWGERWLSGISAAEWRAQRLAEQARQRRRFHEERERRAQARHARALARLREAWGRSAPEIDPDHEAELARLVAEQDLDDYPSIRKDREWYAARLDAPWRGDQDRTWYDVLEDAA